MVLNSDQQAGLWNLLGSLGRRQEMRTLSQSLGQMVGGGGGPEALGIVGLLEKQLTPQALAQALASTLQRQEMRTLSQSLGQMVGGGSSPEINVYVTGNTIMGNADMDRLAMRTGEAVLDSLKRQQPIVHRR